MRKLIVSLLTLLMLMGIAAPSLVEAFPVLADHEDSSEETQVTVHDVDLPSTNGTIPPGQGVILAITFSGGTDPTVTVPNGWSQFIDQTCGGTSNCWAWAAEKTAKGDDGPQIQITTGSARYSAHLSLRIIGQPYPAGWGGWLRSQGIVTGSSTAPDSGNVAGCCSTQQILWFPIAFIGNAASLTPPSGYTNQRTGTSTAGALKVSKAELLNSTNQENPGAWTSGTSSPWLAASIAIYPSTYSIGLGGPYVANQTSNANTSATTSHTVDLPNGVTGDLIISAFSTDSLTASITFPTEWSYATTMTACGSSGCNQRIAWKISDGTEGSTATVTTGASVKSSIATVRVRDFESGDPIVATAAATAGGANPNPPSVTPIAAGEYYPFLVLPTVTWSDSGNCAQGPPGGEDDSYWFVNGTGGAAGVCTTTAQGRHYRDVVDPGVYTGTPGSGTVSTTIVVKPRRIYPRVAARNSSENATTVTTHVVSLPTGIVAGNLLFVNMTFSGTTDPTITFPAGWSSRDSGACGGTPGCWRNLRAKIADGTEGASINVTTSASRTSVHISLRVIGNDPLSLGSLSGWSGGNELINPTSVSFATVRENLFLAFWNCADNATPSNVKKFKNIHTKTNANESVGSMELAAFSPHMNPYQFDPSCTSYAADTYFVNPPRTIPARGFR